MCKVKEEDELIFVTLGKSSIFIGLYYTHIFTNHHFEFIDFICHLKLKLTKCIKQLFSKPNENKFCVGGGEYRSKTFNKMEKS